MSGLFYLLIIIISVNKVNIRTALATDASLISDLANKIWWQAYESILSEEQILFMLKDMYDPAVLSSQISNGVLFDIVEYANKAYGFISTMPKEKHSGIYRIEKIYILKEAQGLGIGKKLINHVEEIAREKGFTTLELNVNRNNPAIGFYEKEGFKIVKEVNIPYHHFILNDYIMQKSI